MALWSPISPERRWCADRSGSQRLWRIVKLRFGDKEVMTPDRMNRFELEKAMQQESPDGDDLRRLLVNVFQSCMQNHAQTLLICMLVPTSVASQIRLFIADVFLAWQAGEVMTRQLQISNSSVFCLVEGKRITSLLSADDSVRNFFGFARVRLLLHK
jgi:hypothetical protein